MDSSSHPSQSAGKSGRGPLLVENIYEKESTESFVERHFRNLALHRCRSTAEFDVEAIAEQFEPQLLRSGQEIELNPEGQGFRPGWTMLLFQAEPQVFWHFLIKSQNNHGAENKGKQFTLTVFAVSAAKAAAEALKLQTGFTVSDDAPGFFMVRDIRNPRRIPIKPEYELTGAMLDLHYGPGFAEWALRFSTGLNQNGLSILRGKPGTGKTSFLRHIIHSLSATHRFYYLPVDAFGLLQAQMADFLSRERQRFPDTVLVLVLEDAEQLLLSRRDFRDGLASSLLNFTDGFVGDLVQAHLICTINGEISDLDEAVLRPGRQRFFREFDLLSWDQATRLAETLEITLTEKRTYSLAELYHFRDAMEADRLNTLTPRPIGFAAL